jgi:RhtB (resistance to homoserine/threonine) family protein
VGMVDSQVMAFTVVAALLTVSPGADTMLVVRNVLRGGRRDGVVTTFGICSGLFVHATLSALGVSVLLMHSAMAFDLVKTAGACYLVWLGVQSLKSAVRGPRHPDNLEDQRAAGAVSWRRSFLEGFLTNMLNPKVAVFYLALLPQFIGPADPVFMKSLLLAAIHYVEGIVWLSGLSIVLDRARRFVLQSVVRRWLDGLCGVVLVGLGARLAVQRQ